MRERITHFPTPLSFFFGSIIIVELNLHSIHFTMGFRSSQPFLSNFLFSRLATDLSCISEAPYQFRPFSREYY